MKEKIINEITKHCEKCPSRECCKEKECVLYRIEQVVLNTNINKSDVNEK